MYCNDDSLASLTPVPLVGGFLSMYKAPAGKSWDRWRIFSDWNLQPDLICSLGGDCIAASQQKVRGLRPFSLPFDWCMSDGAAAIEKLAEQFAVGFSGFARRENLEPIPGSHFGYKDTKTGFSFIHHFKDKIEQEGEFERFDEILQRRISRLHRAIESSGTVLFLLSRTWKVDERCLRAVSNSCIKKWPGKKFQFVLVTYNSQPATIYHNDMYGVIRIPRDRTGYDLREKVFEWSFLDEIRYSAEAQKMHAVISEGDFSH